jgi:predicted nucleotidyltransferase
MKLIARLFTSETRARLLGRLLLGAGRRYYQSEIARLEGVPLGAAVRELEFLLSLGLARLVAAKRRRYWSANPDHPLFAELKTLYLKAGLIGDAIGRFRQLKARIRVAFVFGSVAEHREDAESDLDLAVVGTVSGLEISSLLRGALARVGREVNTRRYTEKELRQKYRAGDGFVRRIADGPKLFILGGDHELRAVVAGR